MPDNYYDDETGRMHKAEVTDDVAASELHELLCCPFCGSDDVTEDYTSVTGCKTERQSGWVECNACQANGPWIEAEDGQIYDGTFPVRVREAWNKAVRAT